MKKEDKPFSWVVINQNYRDNELGEYDILKHREEEFKKMKRKAKTKEDFEKELRSEMVYRFWSRAQFEIIVELTEENRVLISPLFLFAKTKDEGIDVTERKDFDWVGFAKHHISRQTPTNKAKVDIYDQLEWRWDDFVDYCWNYRHKWERRRKEQ